MRTISLVLVSAAFGAGAIGAAVGFDMGSPATPVQEDWDRRPGPDSGRVAMMLDALGRTDAVVCELIADQIGNFWNGGERAGVGRLAAAPRTILAAKDSIGGQVTDARAIDRLVSELSAQNSCVRRVAGKMLGNSSVAPARLRALLGDASATIRESAAYAIGVGEVKELRSSLEAALRDRDPAVGAMAAWALGEIEDRASVPALVAALRGSEPRIRLAAIWALGQIEDTRAVPELIPALRDSDPAIRAMAADALGDIEDDAAVAPLERALGSDADARVRTAAAEVARGVERSVFRRSTGPSVERRERFRAARGRAGDRRSGRPQERATGVGRGAPVRRPRAAPPRGERARRDRRSGDHAGARRAAVGPEHRDPPTRGGGARRDRHTGRGQGTDSCTRGQGPRGPARRGRGAGGREGERLGRARSGFAGALRALVPRQPEAFSGGRRLREPRLSRRGPRERLHEHAPPPSRRGRVLGVVHDPVLGTVRRRDEARVSDAEYAWRCP